jgi:hypothetical protein
MGAQLGGVIRLHRPSRLQQVDRDVREEKPIASCLEQDEADERCPVLTAKPGGGQLVHLGEYQWRHDDRPWQQRGGLTASVTGRFPVVCRARQRYCWSWTCHGPLEPPTELASDACGEVSEQQVHDDLFFDGHQVIKHRVH